MLLENKNALIYGGGGAVGGAIARAFAREGAKVYLAGRTLASLDQVAQEISDAGGKAETAEVDAMDQGSIDRHADGVSARAGGIDIALNAVGIAHVQGTPFADLSFEDYAHPIAAYTRTNFLTVKAVARQMTKQGSGVILLLSPGPGARMSGRGFLGNGVSAAAVEALSRILAGELGPSGIRVNCLRPHAIPEAVANSHTRQLFDAMAGLAGLTTEAWLSGLAGTTLLGRLPTLAEVADYAAFVASDRASAMTGAIVNLTSGALVD
jgi:NAD(P)-dependent dehydrogenase (short-subunit alcohol dehydrogenase family)